VASRCVNVTSKKLSVFRNSLSDNHCLNHLYSVNTKPEGAMQLRDRGHHFALPLVQLDFNKKHFRPIARSLFDLFNIFFIILLIHTSTLYHVRIMLVFMYL